MKLLFTLMIAIVCANGAMSATAPQWNQISYSEASRSGKSLIQATDCKYYSLDPAAMRNYLLNAPMENRGAAPLVLNLPYPDGSLHSFAIVESPVMMPGLAAKYPSIRTFAGKGIDDKSATVRLDFTQWGFHAMIFSNTAHVYIDPVNLNTDNTYIVYDRANLVRKDGGLDCGFNPSAPEEAARISELQAERAARRAPTSANHALLRSIAPELKTYRLALACTGEYAAFYGGTLAGALGGMVTSINRVNEVYELELDVHLTLVDNNDTLVFLNANTDPYTNSNGGTMLGQNQTTVTARIGSGNYDIGHVFSTGGGGIAGLGVICNSTQKARGVTGSPAPINDAYDIDYVAHEMGHQFGGNHTFNGNTGSCGGNGVLFNAFEPGSGSTIMAYAGICPGQDVQAHSDPYFHTASFDEIEDYITSGNGSLCPVITATGNTAPVITLTTGNFSIPYLTPFQLAGSAYDPDGDTITYCWEEYDSGGPFGSIGSATGNAPIFRSINPTVDSFRVFPKMQTILAGLLTGASEALPTYARVMNFRLTVRDNRLNGGGVTYEEVLTQVSAINTGAGFKVTNFNTGGGSWPALSNQVVTWNVSGTTGAPINTANVNILLSSDNGATYTMLVANAPNTGTCNVTLPNVQSTTCRLKVEAVGNIFFDINDRAFSLTAPVGLAQLLNNESVHAYPNPTAAGEEITFTMTGSYRGDVQIHVTDLAGREVMQRSFVKTDITHAEVFGLPSASAGVYLIEALTAEGRAVEKLVIE